MCVCVWTSMYSFVFVCSVTCWPATCQCGLSLSWMRCAASIGFHSQTAMGGPLLSCESVSVSTPRQPKNPGRIKFVVFLMFFSYVRYQYLLHSKIRGATMGHGLAPSPRKYEDIRTNRENQTTVREGQRSRVFQGWIHRFRPPRPRAFEAHVPSATWKIKKRNLTWENSSYLFYSFVVLPRQNMMIVSVLVTSSYILFGSLFRFSSTCCRFELPIWLSSLERKRTETPL